MIEVDVHSWLRFNPKVLHSASQGEVYISIFVSELWQLQM